jgi:hypothetical protein
VFQSGLEVGEKAGMVQSWVCYAEKAKGLGECSSDVGCEKKSQTKESWNRIRIKVMNNIFWLE